MEKIFVDGMKFNRPVFNAPSFVKGRIQIKTDELVPFLQKHQNERGWVDIELKESQAGKLYLELNQWEPKTREEVSSVDEGPDPEKIPF